MAKRLLQIVIILSVALRLIGLGYSDFQGDEVSAQNYLFGSNSFTDNNFSNFLLTRSIGPLQYIVSFVVNYLVYGKLENTGFFVRLPFALAGVISIYLVYKLCRKHFNGSTALLAAFFLSTSGLFIAFSKIVQYQSFVILLIVASLYLFFNFLETSKLHYLIWLGLLSGLSFLFHYDSLSFIIPVLLFLCFYANNFKTGFKYCASVLVPFLCLSGLFYVPFLFNPSFKNTFAYLVGNRITSNFKYDSLYYSFEILKVYHPKEILFLLGALFLLILSYFGIKNWRILSKYKIYIALFFVFVSALRLIYVIRNPILIGLSGLSLVFLIVCLLINLNKYTFIILWFLFSFLIYGVVIVKPLTHIYNFLLPFLFILAIYVPTIFQKYLNHLYFVFFIFGIISLSFNYQAFINVSPEYPWNAKHYILGNMYSNTLDTGQISGIFGFPYKRNWVEIGRVVKDLNISSYNSNEKYNITKYYLQGSKWQDYNSDIHIWVKNPQSFSLEKKPEMPALIDTPTYSIYTHFN